MWKITLGAAAALAILAVGGNVQANITSYNVVLSGLQEVPPNSSTATGQAVVTVDSSTGQISIVGSYAGLSSGVTGAHLHGFAPAGGIAGILIGLSIDPGSTSGAFSGQGVFDQQQLGQFFQDLTYINVHSSNFPAGEIRGQVIIPEPGSLALLGAAGLMLIRRRR